MPVMQTRLALALVSLATIGLELALMRTLAFRFWSHLAAMVIAVALLGFGASGTALTLLRRRIIRRPRAWLVALLWLFAIAVALVPRVAQYVPLTVQFLAWHPAHAVTLLALELLMFVPFFLAGAVVGVALMDRPERLAGHYAANLIGSGLGAVLAVLAMHGLSTGRLFIALAAAGWLAAAVLVPWRRARFAGPTVAVALTVLGLAVMFPWQPAPSQFKPLAGFLNMPGTRVIHHAEGPLGRIDVLAGPSVRELPGLSLKAGRPPEHVVLLTDGGQPSPVFNCPRREDWAFMEQTTRAAPYPLYDQPRVLIIGAGGGADIGLAWRRTSAQIVALEMNPQVIAAMKDPLRERGGGIYLKPNVDVVAQEARGYLSATARKFDMIQLPPLDAFGASGAGLHAAQESYLYTVESFADMLDHLAEGGVLCVTRWAQSTAPRDELRAFDIAAEALRRRGRDPATCMAIVRNMYTVSVLAFRGPVGAQAAERLRAFCRARRFVLAYLPGLAAPELNRGHRLPRPYYHEAAAALVGPERDAYLDRYLFDVRATTDDRPYFFRTFGWGLLPRFLKGDPGLGPAFVELGFVMSVAALVQSALAAAVLIVLPLAARARTLRRAKRKAAVFAYFLMLGLGFMLLEIGFLQRLILYLAHPIYAAAAVIASFLVFSGLGSLLSRRWSAPPRRVIAVAALAVVAGAVACWLLLDRWLALTHAGPIPLRFAVACLTIAPLAFAMGHLFPTGLRQVGRGQPSLVPWAWAVNGFASVVAAVGTPLLAAEIGFTRLVLLAVLCYALAGWSSRWLPE